MTVMFTFFTVTFPGRGISQVRAVKTDLIVGSGGVKDKKNPAAAADEEQGARPSESSTLFFSSSPSSSFHFTFLFF